MREAMRNLMEMNPQNLILEVYIGLGLIWAMLLIAGLWSIITSRSPIILKILWSLVIIGLPMVGMLAYALYCVLQLDFRLLTNRAQVARQLKKERAMAASSIGGASA
jgi:hypothetical protein